MTPDDTALAIALARLAAHLDDPSLDLGLSFAQLAAAVRAAVPSYTGMSMTLNADGIPVTITARANGDTAGSAAAAEVATSLVMPLTTISFGTDGELVFFASAVGAFVDLAADLAHETASELGTFALDTRLGAPLAPPVSADGFLTIEQAIGVLIETGHTPEQARARIAQIAAADGHDLAAAARRIISGEER